MCGRYTLTVADIAELARAWGAEVDAALRAGWRPRHNLAPGQLAPLLTGEGGTRRLVPAAFGLPAPRGGFLVNARAETAAEKRTFRDAMSRSRAAVPADGFFEWEGPPSARRPTWFHPADGGPFLMAALALPAPGGQGALAFAILTTGSVEPVSRLHDRMPVILPAGLVDRWLAAGPPPPLPAPEPGRLAGRRVSPRVNSPLVDDPDCLAPREPARQMSLL